MIRPLLDVNFSEKSTFSTILIDITFISMPDRRDFLKKLSLATTITTVGSARGLIKDLSTEKWLQVKKQYLREAKGPINFNTGSAGIMPLPVLSAYQRNLEELHSGAPYEVSDNHATQVSDAMKRLVELIKASEGRLALMPNTTAAINAILYGIFWNEGDEIIYSNVDYPLVHNTIRLLEYKYGIVPKRIELDLQSDDVSAILAKYAKAYTAKSRLTLITHMTHKEGHIMPVQQLIAQAQEHGSETLLDGAHSAGQFEFSLQELGCDYYATSLHKWLSAPLGTGLLYVKETSLKDLSPPMSYNPDMQDRMSMFTVHGTSAFQNAMTLGATLDFQQGLGFKVKENRLREMKTYFRAGLAEQRGVEIITDAVASCGICSFHIIGKSKRSLIKRFEEEHNIHIKYTSYPGKRGFFRASLNLNLDESDIDLLLASIHCFAQEK